MVHHSCYWLEGLGVCSKSPDTSKTPRSPTYLGVSEIRVYLIGVLTKKGSYYLGV